MAEKIEQLIKKYLENKSDAVLGQRDDRNYPSTAELYGFLNDELEGVELEKMLRFLKNNADGQRLVQRARELLKGDGGWENEAVDPVMVQKARSLMGGQPQKSVVCPHCGKPITPFKRPLNRQKWVNLFWSLLTVSAFMLSFILRRYFMQCLAISVLAGIRWIVEMRAMKTQILIYKALSEDSPNERGLHQHSSRL